MANALLLEFPLDAGQKMVGQHADEEVPPQPAVYPMESRPQAQFALQTAKGVFYVGEHHIEGPEFALVQVSPIRTQAAGTGEPDLHLLLPVYGPGDLLGGTQCLFDLYVVELGNAGIL